MGYTLDVLLSETERSILDTKFLELFKKEVQVHAITATKIYECLDRNFY